MIKEEDCCDNCEEGIEPCCDEELAQHIEEHIVEHTKPEQQTDIVTEGVTLDIEELARHLCCKTSFHVIYDAMYGLDKNGLIKLRDMLKEYTPTNSLHPHLNAVFEKAIDHA
jgi:hypothetical protein